jgi:hypothetical protein
LPATTTSVDQSDTAAYAGEASSDVLFATAGGASLPIHLLAWPTR